MVWMYMPIEFRRYKKINTVDGSELALTHTMRGVCLGYSPVSANRKLVEFGKDPSVVMYELYTRNCNDVETSDRIEFMGYSYDIICCDTYSVIYNQNKIIIARKGAVSNDRRNE